MHAAGQRDAYVMPDDGSGKLEIWRVEDFELAAWPADRHGEFYSGDSFVLLYTYKVRRPYVFLI